MTLVSVVLPVKVQADPEILRDLEALGTEVLIQREPGITNAVWHGVKRARGQLVAIMDGDGSHRVADLLRMLHYQQFLDADLVVGVRYEFGYPLWRRLISFTFNKVARLFLCLWTEDPMSSMFIGPKAAMQFKNVRSCKFGLELQLHAKRVFEVPIQHQPKPGHKSHIKPIEAIYLLWQMVRLKGEKIP
jgi:hypothetical protein